MIKDITIEIIKESCQKQKIMNNNHDNLINKLCGKPEIKKEMPNYLKIV